MAEPRWTSEQAAALVADGHRLLVANAGTGKTTTVVGKILWLLGEDVGVDEAGVRIPKCANPCTLEQIAAITFTEKAAYDLKRKLREEIRKSPRADELQWHLDRAALGTIHSFCGDLLREHALRMGIDPTFVVLDEQDARLQQELLIRDIVLEQLRAGDQEAAEIVRTYRLVGYTFTNGAVDLVRDAFRDLRWHGERYRAWCTDDELDGAALERVFGSAFEDKDLRTLGRCRALYRMADRMRTRWADYERAENVRDFDSLILDARALLTGAGAEAALSGIRGRYRILIIDEFQDTDGAQRDIAYAIAGLQAQLPGAPHPHPGVGAPGPQLFLVGDPKQSIYRFRGADVSVWNQVAEHLARVAPALPLSRNFRSDPVVIDFVNAAAGRALRESALCLRQTHQCVGVEYAELHPARTHDAGAVEWITPEDGKEDIRRRSEAAHVAARIRALIDNGEPIVDPETGKRRGCKYSDIALLYRTRTGLAPFPDALRAWGIPFHEHSPAGLAERPEVLDLLNVLRLIHNPADDLRAFAYLRSPFVGLRDEVLVRIRQEQRGGSYLQQAAAFLEGGEWFAAAEHAQVDAIERDALRNGLAAFRRARALADRIAIDELLEMVLDDSGYRHHLLLLEGSREALANIHSFLRLVEHYRDHTIGRFLELWDRRDDDDPGMPQGQLYSRADNVVTLSTIHAAKGLEWPVVFLIDTSQAFRDAPWGRYWNDAQFGPILCPAKEQRGPRSDAIAERNRAQELAEQARLLYVAATRARDRLIVVGEGDSKNSQAAWLAHGLRGGAVPPMAQTPERPPRVGRTVALSWLDHIAAGVMSPLSAPLRAPPARFTTSATELMTRDRDLQAWEQLYVHGVESRWQFAPRRGTKRAAVPERIRGDIIHCVLERIRTEQELAQVLEETIGELAAQELETVLAPGSAYRDALTAEIERVIASAEWQWYVAPGHYRELPFLHLAGPRQWLLGAFDLYRPDGWIIDFKTHQVSAAGVAAAAAKYTLQMHIYREAALVRGAVQTRLHFTHPGVVVDVV